MGMCATAKLVYGLSFDEDEFSREKLAEFYGVAEDDIDINSIIAEAAEGLQLVLHTSYDASLYIIGVGCKTCDWGDVEAIDALPAPTPRQAAELARLQASLGGKLGVWLCAMYG